MTMPIIEVIPGLHLTDTRVMSGFSEQWAEQLPSTSFGDHEITGESYYKAVFVTIPKTLEKDAALDAADYPILASIWDNAADAEYNTV
ncbi:MAG: hypothetical protein HYU29_01595 [Chloroflexi bacterium]|nr:hypothetical protein [Chloroflexota bacterium]